MNSRLLLKSSDMACPPWRSLPHVPAAAQDQPPAAETQAAERRRGRQIIVTAQRRAQLLQDVPIAVSAFYRRGARAPADRECQRPSAEPSQRHLHQDQLHLVELHHPRRRRPVRRLLVRHGDRHPRQRHAAHLDPPVRDRIFRPRADRGAARPAGHAFGRNATSGVVNFITARPDLNDVPRQRQRRIWQFRFDQAERDGQRADRRDRRRPPRRLFRQSRRLYRESVRRQPRSTTARSTRCAARSASSRARAPPRPDRLLFPRERQPLAHPEAALQPRPTGILGCSARQPRVRDGQRQFDPGGDPVVARVPHDQQSRR